MCGPLGNFADPNTVWIWIHTMWLKSGISWQLYFCAVASVFTQILFIVSVFNFEPSHSRTTYLTIRSSYCSVFLSIYHISWDKCSQKPQNLACLIRINSQSEKEMQKYCRPSHCIKSHAAKEDWKGNEALRCAVGQPSTVLSVDQSDQTTCSRERSGEKKLKPCQPRSG